MFRSLSFLPILLAALLLSESGCSKSDGDKPSVDSPSSGRNVQQRTAKKPLPSPNARYK
jgi:hypothetical protein